VTATLFAIAIHSAAQEPAADTREAGKHFERGVVLYGETDYPGALVEFKRAYALAPNAAVLYNVGEAEYQLQDYAGALLTFTRYLAEAPAGAGRRVEVEADIEILRARVGHLSVVTVPAGADVLVDDQPAGKTPLEERLLVSVGHRKVTASLPGGPSATRYVDVAAEDNVSVTLDLPTALVATATSHTADATTRSEPRPSRAGSVWPTLGWVATGILAAGAASAGAFALKESSDLKSARNAFPAVPQTLQQDADRTRTYSILADSLTSAAVILGGITLWSTLKSSASARRSDGEAALRLTPSSVDFGVTF
jgi:tetratricopeptide (TPR) repeat protein